MKKSNDDTEESVKEKKANAKTATKKKEKAALKAAGDKLLVDMASKQEGGGASQAFLKANAELDELEKKAEVIRLAKKGVRARLREQKVDLSCLDRVRKLRAMEPEDVRAKKATEALYEAQLGLELSDEQKKAISELDKRRAEARQSIIKANGGDTGKEVGSATEEEEETGLRANPLDTGEAEEEDIPPLNADVIPRSAQTH